MPLKPAVVKFLAMRVPVFLPTTMKGKQNYLLQISMQYIQFITCIN